MHHSATHWYWHIAVDIVKDDSGYRVIMTQGSFEISDPVEEENQNDIINALRAHAKIVSHYRWGN